METAVDEYGVDDYPAEARQGAQRPDPEAMWE